MAKSGKKYIQALSKIDKRKSYSVDEAISLLKEITFVKFDETIDVSVNLNLKKNHTVRDTVVLPNQFMKEKRILVFAKGDKAEEARKLALLMLEMMILLIRLKEVLLLLILLLQPLI